VGTEHVRSVHAYGLAWELSRTHLNLPTNDEPPLLRSVGSIDIR
jgi:hypothetical protein